MSVRLTDDEATTVRRAVRHDRSCNHAGTHWGSPRVCSCGRDAALALLVAPAAETYSCERGHETGQHVDAAEVA